MMVSTKTGLLMGVSAMFVAGALAATAQQGLSYQAQQVLVEDVESLPAEQVVIPEATSVQPPTVVEANPLTDSKAERLRKARQEAEIRTEQKIVEKLEESRLQDEHARAQRLFGDRLGTDNDPMLNQVVLKPVPVAPPVVVAPSAPEAPAATLEKSNTPIPVVIIDDKASETSVEEDMGQIGIADEVRAAVREELNASEALIEEPVQAEPNAYFQFMAGSMFYSAVDNIQSRGSLGFVVGTELDNNLVIEGGFAFSNFYVEEQYLIYREFDQYNFMANLKYQFMNGRKVRPSLGAAASYTIRKYSECLSDDRYVITSNEDYACGRSVESSTIDLGMAAGVDVAIASNFMIGLEYRYMVGIYKNSKDIRISEYAAGTDLVEDQNYGMLSLSSKITF